MKRVDESDFLSAHIPRVRLYRSDVESLIDIIKNAGLVPIISDTSFTYDSLDELKAEKGSDIVELEIKGADPEGSGVRGITLRLSNRNDAYLSLYGRRPILETCWHRLREFLKSKRRWHQTLTNPWVAWVFVLLTCFPAEILRISNALHPVSSYVFAYGLSLSYFAFTLWWDKKYPVVLLDRQHEYESYWKRNGDKIILLIAGATIATLANIFASFFSKE
jgi:hypothetical protein